MTVEETKEGMKYNWELTSKGMQITLFPVKGRHNQDAIKRAKTEVRGDHHVVIVELEWISITQHNELALTTPQKVKSNAEVSKE